MKSLEYIGFMPDVDSLNHEIAKLASTECKNIYDEKPPAIQITKAAWLRQRIVTELVERKKAVESLKKIEMKHEKGTLSNIKNKKKLQTVLKNKRENDFVFMQINKPSLCAWIEELSEDSIRFLNRVEHLEKHSSSFVIIECFMGICTKNMMYIPNYLDYPEKSRMNCLMHIEQKIV